MNESDGWLTPYEEVPKVEGSTKKMKFMTSKEGALQATNCPMIST